VVKVNNLVRMRRMIHAFRTEYQGRLNLVWGVAMLAWLAALIATPISIWVNGEGSFPPMATLGVLAQCAATLISLACKWSMRRLLLISLLVALGTWAVEWLGVTSGYPFGDYDYTQVLQPQIAKVPLLIPLAWLMMLPTAWGIGAALLENQQSRLGRWYWLLYALLAGAAFTAWDFYLDPQMTTRGLWTWQDNGGYFGIPWSNFLGWWLTASLLTWLVRPTNLPRLRLMSIYTLTWLFQFIGLGLFWGKPGAALVGFAAMGMFAITAWRKESRQWKSSSGAQSVSSAAPSHFH
jgi:putative membrane protein